MTAETSTIPIVDFSAWHAGASVDKKKAIATRLIDACRDVGFVYITNHSVSPERLAEAFAMSRRLFDLPMEKKKLAPHPPGFAVHRGYSWPGLEKVSNAMGDEENKEKLVNSLRAAGDVKVGALFHRPFVLAKGPDPRRATKSAVRRTETSPINGFLRVSSQASESSRRIFIGNVTARLSRS